MFVCFLEPLNHSTHMHTHLHTQEHAHTHSYGQCRLSSWLLSYQTPSMMGQYKERSSPERRVTVSLANKSSPDKSFTMTSLGGPCKRVACPLQVVLFVQSLILAACLDFVRSELFPECFAGRLWSWTLELTCSRLMHLLLLPLCNISLKKMCRTGVLPFL